MLILFSFKLHNIDLKLIFKNKLMECDKDKCSQEDVEDLAWMWFYLLFSTFIWPTTKGGLYKNLLSYIENIVKMKNLNWARFLHSLIFTNIEVCQ